MTIAEDSQPTTRELCELIISVKEATELGFARTDKRFDAVRLRLDRVETCLDRVETRLDGVETRLDGVEARLTSVDGRLHGLERRFDRVAAQNVPMVLKDHESRIQKLEQRNFESS